MIDEGHMKTDGQGSWLHELTEKVMDHLDAMANQLVMLRMRSRWATYTEAERYAHVAHGVISEAVKRGEIVAYKRNGGRRVLVHLDDVDGWIRAYWISPNTELSER